MALHNRTILVTLTIRGWQAQKKDERVTREVHEKHQATDAGVFRKHLIDPKALKNIQHSATAARTFHYQNTLPWGEQGARILTTEGKPDYDLKMRVLKEEYQFHVGKFLKRYPDEIARAKTQLNGLFNIAEYPDVSDLHKRFQFTTMFMPVPHVDDFRIQLAQRDMNQVKADLAAQLETYSRQAQRDLWQRLHDAITAVSETLKDPRRRWFKNTFAKLDEMADVIKTLNYTDNQELNDLARSAKDRFATLDLSHCKQHTQSRVAAANEAEKMLAQISNFI